MIRRRDADVAAHALLFPFAKARQRLIGVVDVVELQEIDFLGAQAAERALEFDVVGSFEFGGDEQFGAQALRCGDLAEHGLGVAIRGSCIDQAAAAIEQRADHGRRLRSRFWIVAVEYFGGAEPDGWQPLAGLWEWRV